MYLLTTGTSSRINEENKFMEHYTLPATSQIEFWVHRQNVPRQNVPRDKTSHDKTSQDIRSQGQNVLGTKCPKDKTSQGTKRHRDKTSQGKNVPGTNVPRDKISYSNYQIFNNKIVLENWQHTRMLGNGPQPCTKFVIGVFLFWGG